MTLVWAECSSSLRRRKNSSHRFENSLSARHEAALGQFRRLGRKLWLMIAFGQQIDRKNEAFDSIRRHPHLRQFEQDQPIFRKNDRRSIFLD